MCKYAHIVLNYVKVCIDLAHQLLTHFLMTISMKIDTTPVSKLRINLTEWQQVQQTMTAVGAPRRELHEVRTLGLALCASNPSLVEETEHYYHQEAQRRQQQFQVV